MFHKQEVQTYTSIFLQEVLHLYHYKALQGKTVHQLWVLEICKTIFAILLQSVVAVKKKKNDQNAKPVVKKA